MADLGATKEAVRLCELIVRDAFGDIVARVAATLLNRGRLPSFSIQRLSGLPRPQVLKALLILTQHNLILTNGGSSWGEGIEDTYGMNIPECLLRLRWARILSIAANRFGPVAVDIIKQIMVYGKLKSTEIAIACGNPDPNYHTEIEAMLLRLLREGFLQPTCLQLTISYEARFERKYATIRAEKQKSLGGGSMAFTANDLLTIQKEATFALDGETKDLLSHERIITKKEKPSHKKGSKRGEDRHEYGIRPNIAIRLNYDRFGVVMRDEIIVKAAKDRWNQPAAAVVQAMLQVTSDERSRLGQSTSTAATPDDIIKAMPSNSYKLLAAGLSGAKSKEAGDLVPQYLEIMSNSDNVWRESNPFLSPDASGGSGFHVEFEAIAVKARANLLLDLVRGTLGGRSARVLATVAKAHNITEQQVRDCAMMPLREVRTSLAALQNMHLVELSEISKFPQAKRQLMTSTSEHHMWSIDLPRAYNGLLTNTYKVMANILQRQMSERAKREGALGREEVAIKRGHTREVLSTKDKEDLDDLDDILRKLRLAENRCEMTIFLMRDLPGWPTKLVKQETKSDRLGEILYKQRAAMRLRVCVLVRTRYQGQ